MNPFVKFMASTSGRLVRIVAGLAIIGWALLGLQGTAALIAVVVGVVPLAAGLVDICLFAPLFSNPVRGSEIRAGK